VKVVLFYSISLEISGLQINIYLELGDIVNSIKIIFVGNQLFSRLHSKLFPNFILSYSVEGEKGECTTKI
jgi:hypothetical protein